MSKPAQPQRGSRMRRARADRMPISDAHLAGILDIAEDAIIAAGDELHPDAKIIILTGHGSMEYARHGVTG